MGKSWDDRVEEARKKDERKTPAPDSRDLEDFSRARPKPPVSEQRCQPKHPDGCICVYCEGWTERRPANATSPQSPAPPEQPAPTFAELEAILDPLYDGAADKRRLLRDVRGWLANHCLDCGEFIGDKPWRCKCTPAEQPARGDGPLLGSALRSIYGTIREAHTKGFAAGVAAAKEAIARRLDEDGLPLSAEEVRSLTVEVLDDAPGKEVA